MIPLIPDPEIDIYMDSWREAAACADDSTIDFFVDPHDVTATAAARALCATCPVAGDCLTWSIETNQNEGIWGGHTPIERRSIRRRWLEETRRAS